MGPYIMWGLLILLFIIIIFVFGKCYCGCPLRSCIMYGHSKCMEKFVNPTRTITFHYTNWCPACLATKPTWAQLKKVAQDSKINFIEVDEDKAKSPDITKYPTIKMVDENGHMYDYVGPNDVKSMLSWALQPHVPKSTLL